MSGSGLSGGMVSESIDPYILSQQVLGRIAGGPFPVQIPQIPNIPQMPNAPQVPNIPPQLLGGTMENDFDAGSFMSQAFDLASPVAGTPRRPGPVGFNPYDILAMFSGGTGIDPSRFLR